MKNNLKHTFLIILSMIFFFGTFNYTVSAAGGELTVEQIIGNTLINGSFENDVTGWSTENAAVSRDIENTYNNSAGAAHVVVADGETGYIHQDVSIRKYTWYIYSVAVKNADADATNVSATLYLDYTADTWNIASTKELSSVNIGDGWTLLSGYFMKTNETSAQDTWNNDDFFQTARVRLQISGSRDYYIDDFKLCMQDGFYNPNFENGTDGWDYQNSTDENKTLEVTTATEDDGAENVGKNVMNVTLSSNNSGLNQVICLEKGVEYEVNAKFKPVEEITDISSVRIRVNRSLPTNASSNITSHYFGVTPVTSNGEWFTLRSSYVYDGEAPYAYADFKLWTYINGAGNPVGFEYKVLSFEVKKRTNVMENPCLIKAEAGVSAIAAPTLSEWKGSPKIEQTLINQGKFTESPSTVYDTYDNSNSRMKFVPTGDGTDFESSSAYQEITLKENGLYDISAYVKPSNDLSGSLQLVAMHIGTGSPILDVLDEVDASTVQEVWTKLAAEEGFSFTDVPEGYTHSQIGIRVIDGSGKAVYIDDLSVVEKAVAPVIDSVSIDEEIKAGKNIAAPMVTLTNPAARCSYRYRYMLYDAETGGDGTLVVAGHSNVGAALSSFSIPLKWAGKYLSVEITPLYESGIWGESMESSRTVIDSICEVTLLESAPDGYTGTITDGGTIRAGIKFVNSDSSPVPVLVIITYSEGGRISKVNMQNVVVPAGGSQKFTPAVTLPSTLGADPSVKVLVWKGRDTEDDTDEYSLQRLAEAFPRN